MNNRGFTLIELLGVVVLLAVIVTIAVPSISGISKKIKQNMLDAKIDLILEEAKMYGQDYLSNIASSTSTVTLDGSTYPCQNLQISELITEGYLDADEGTSELINPVTNKAELQNNYLILYYKNKRVVAIMQDENLDGTNEYSCN